MSVKNSGGCIAVYVLFNVLVRQWYMIWEVLLQGQDGILLQIRDWPIQHLGRWCHTVLQQKFNFFVTQQDITTKNAVYQTVEEKYQRDQ